MEPKFKFIPIKKIPNLPETTGVYAFKKEAELLYIGKANNLKERVKQHPGLLGQAGQLGFIQTQSEIEALILEAKLIKKFQPKFNVLWKDDKNYFYVAITKEPFPRIFIAHQPQNEGNRISLIGPFVDGTALKQTLKTLRKVFPYRSCNKLPKKPCLWYQLERCLAPCAGLTSTVKDESKANVKHLIKILQGKKNQTLNDLKKEMKKLSQAQKYERANRIKNQIQSLEKVLSHARLWPAETRFPAMETWFPKKRMEGYDVSNIQGKEATGSMVVFINGKPDKSQYRKFRIKTQKEPDDIAMLKEILTRRFNHPEWPYPDLILIDGGKAQFNAAKDILSRWSLDQIRVMSLAKKKNELYMEGKKKPVLLKTLPREVSNLILQLRDEAHRFAISYHKKLRKMVLIEN